MSSVGKKIILVLLIFMGREANFQVSIVSNPGMTGFVCQVVILNDICLLQVLKKISRYIQEQNNSVYIPHGLLLVDPVERGLRVVSF